MYLQMASENTRFIGKTPSKNSFADGIILRTTGRLRLFHFTNTYNQKFKSLTL